MNPERLFPDLKDAKWGRVWLNQWAEHLMKEGKVAPFQEGKSTLLDSKKCQKFVDLVHKRLGVEFSYGGFMEDRSTLWGGSYMEKDNRYVHLGVDFNVPAGTRISLPFTGKIIRVDDDTPAVHGWGPRVFLELDYIPYVMIFAHLKNIHYKRGDKIRFGDVLAEVGDKNNGGWYTHLHLQSLLSEAYRAYCKRGLGTLDGYISRRDVSRAWERFADPLPLVGWGE